MRPNCSPRVAKQVSASVRTAPSPVFSNVGLDVDCRVELQNLAQDLGKQLDMGARAQSVLMSVWRACWQQGCCALNLLRICGQKVSGTLQSQFQTPLSHRFGDYAPVM